jgi:hypothetical protein
MVNDILVKGSKDSANEHWPESCTYALANIMAHVDENIGENGCSSLVIRLIPRRFVAVHFAGSQDANDGFAKGAKSIEF